jgi:hypothetical protein
VKCGSSPRSTGNVCLPASLEDLRSELPDDILLHAIASHPEAHERLGEQLIERELLVASEVAAGCAEWHLSNPS